MVTRQHNINVKKFMNVYVRKQNTNNENPHAYVQEHSYTKIVMFD